MADQTASVTAGGNGYAQNVTTASAGGGSGGSGERTAGSVGAASTSGAGGSGGQGAIIIIYTPGQNNSSKFLALLTNR